MLNLPLTGTAERELFTLEHLAEIARPENRAKIPGLMDALRGATRTIAATHGAIKSITSFVHRANGELWMIEIDAEGGWKKLWNFGML